LIPPSAFLLARPARHPLLLNFSSFLIETRSVPLSLAVTLTANASPARTLLCLPRRSRGGGGSLLSIARFFILLTLRLASISALKFEATYKGKIRKRGAIGVAAIIEGKIMNLSVEAKVAIAVATGFVVLIVGAMAQG